MSTTIQIPTDGGALVLAGAAVESVRSSAEATRGEAEKWQTRYPLDPNNVIAAFKAAGITIPNFGRADEVIE